MFKFLCTLQSSKDDRLSKMKNCISKKSRRWIPRRDGKGQKTYWATSNETLIMFLRSDDDDDGEGKKKNWVVILLNLDNFRCSRESRNWDPFMIRWLISQFIQTKQTIKCFIEFFLHSFRCVLNLSSHRLRAQKRERAGRRQWQKRQEGKKN